jgi:hypothetical protein
MKVTMYLSLLSYDNLMERCEPTCREYMILLNGRLMWRLKGKRFAYVMKITCRMDDANRLLDFATQVYPNAAPEIEEAVANACNK